MIFEKKTVKFHVSADHGNKIIQFLCQVLDQRRDGMISTGKSWNSRCDWTQKTDEGRKMDFFCWHHSVFRFPPNSSPYSFSPGHCALTSFLICIVTLLFFLLHGVSTIFFHTRCVKFMCEIHGVSVTCRGGLNWKILKNRWKTYEMAVARPSFRLGLKFVVICGSKFKY